MNVDEYNAQIAAGMSEAKLQELVLGMMRATGWERRYHTHDSRRSHKGFPDLVAVRRRDQRVVWVELKSEKGRVRPEQQEWLEDLRWARQEAFLWRPSDYLCGTVERVLR